MRKPLYISHKADFIKNTLTLSHKSHKSRSNEHSNVYAEPIPISCLAAHTASEQFNTHLFTPEQHLLLEQQETDLSKRILDVSKPLDLESFAPSDIDELTICAILKRMLRSFGCVDTLLFKQYSVTYLQVIVNVQRVRFERFWENTIIKFYPEIAEKDEKKLSKSANAIISWMYPGHNGIL
jgi:hypothetical protein